MNLMSLVRALMRRWYIVVVGVLIAVGAASVAWQMVPPTYERTATQLLLPGSEIMPENGNPFLYLGGLGPAADVLVTAMTSESDQRAITGGEEDAAILVTRDGSSSGPQLLIVASGASDAEAATVLDAAVAQTAVVLDRLQDLEQIGSDNRIGIKTIAADVSSTLEQRTRLMLAVGAGFAVLLASFVLVAIVDGRASTRGSRRGRTRVSARRVSAERFAEESLPDESDARRTSATLADDREADDERLFAGAWTGDGGDDPRQTPAIGVFSATRRPG